MTLRAPLEPLALLKEFPRSQWTSTRQQQPTARLLLSRHGGFRRRVEGLLSTTQDALADRQSPPEFCYYLATELHYFVPLLEGHHQAETARLYPRLLSHFPMAAQSFQVLEKDHNQLDEAIEELSQSPERLMTQAPTRKTFHTETERLFEQLSEFQKRLARHLDDEEDLVIPILLKLELSLDL